MSTPQWSPGRGWADAEEDDDLDPPAPLPTPPVVKPPVPTPPAATVAPAVPVAHGGAAHGGWAPVTESPVAVVVPGGSRPELPAVAEVTGHARVDEALAAVNAHAGAPPGAQIAPLTAAHEVLRSTLDSIGDV